MQSYHNVFPGIINPESLFRAWEMFRRGKSGRADVQEFECSLERNIFALHRELRSHEYRHGPYQAFTVCDPKPRRIHKAVVRDRIVHHAVFAALEPLFDPAFFAHSYSCRKGKGTHRAVRTLHTWLHQVGANGHKPCFALQCDIHRFFDSISHSILLGIIGRRLKDARALWLVGEIVGSFRTDNASHARAAGLPLGNLTSQLFANVYLDELDQFLKHELRVGRYLRYTDDFAVVASDPRELGPLIEPIRAFLQGRLLLSLHPRKVTVRKFRQGIDFLGYVLSPCHRVLRTRTKRRMFRRLREKVALHRTGQLTKAGLEQSLQSYLGILSHANCHKLRNDLLNQYWFWMAD
jgi:RNA-directed DNA polymerase